MSKLKEIMEAVAKGLPMDEASRLARAKEMGFDTSKTYYHGTGSNFNEFRSDKPNWFSGDPEFANNFADVSNQAKNIEADQAIKSLGKAKYEAIYGPDREKAEALIPKLTKELQDILDKPASGQVLPVYLKSQNPFIHDMKGAPHGIGDPTIASIIKKAKEAGHDSVVLRNGLDGGIYNDQTVMLKPENIRSKFAEFDPEKKDSKKILAGLTGAGILGAGMLGGEGEAEASMPKFNKLGEIFEAVNKLPMDEASRMARAKEIGFNPAETWYHGTKADIENFDPNALGASTNAPSAKRGFFFTKDPSTASDYSKLSKDRAQLRSMADYQAALTDYSDAQRALYNKYGPEYSELETIFSIAEGLKSQVKRWQDDLSRVKPGVPMEAEYRALLLKKQKELDHVYDTFPKLKEWELDPLWIKTQQAKENYQVKERIARDLDGDQLGTALKTDPRMKELDKQIDDAFAEYRAQPDSDGGYSDMSFKTQNLYAKARELEQKGRDLRDQIAQEIGTQGSNVLPTHLKMQNPYTHDFKGQPYRDESYNNILKKAQEEGHDSVVLKNTYDPADSLNRKLIDVGVVFDPSQVRSKFAKFDPEKVKSGLLTAGLGAAVGAGALLGGENEAEAAIGAPLPSIKKFQQIAKEYNLAKKIPNLPEFDYLKVDPDRAKRIAKAFEEMPHNPNDPEVKRAYDALINETKDQFQKIKESGLKIEKIKPGQENPYPKGSAQMQEDMEKNNHLWYYPTESGFGTETAIKDHPLLVKTGEKIGDDELVANDMFRIVHDVFGHAKEGVGFGARGEENAYQAHKRMFSPEAQKALATETRGQNSWVNYGPHGESNRLNPGNTIYADQKAGVLPDWAIHEGTPETASKIAALKKIAGIGGVVGAGSMIPSDAYTATTKPIFGINPSEQMNPLEMTGEALSAVDKYTGQPARAGLLATMKGENPLKATKESFGSDKETSGKEVAHKFLQMTEEAGMPLRAPGMEEYPSEGPLGLGVEMTVDPTNISAVGAATKLKALSRIMRGI